MKNHLLLILGICLCVDCNKHSIYRYTQAFQTTVKVLDADGKPVLNQDVQLFTGSSINSLSSFNHIPTEGLTATAKTDMKGNAIFNYELFTSGGWDSPTLNGVATFAIKDDTFRNTVMLDGFDYSTKSQKETIKSTTTVHIDSLLPVKVRIYKTSTSPLAIWFRATTIFPEKPKEVRRNFVSWNKYYVQKFDTTFTFLAYAKTQFSIRSTLDSLVPASPQSNNFIKTISEYQFIVDAATFKDSSLTIRY